MPATAIQHECQAAIAPLLILEELARAAGAATVAHLARDAITANQRIILLVQRTAPTRRQPGEGEISE